MIRLKICVCIIIINHCIDVVNVFLLNSYKLETKFSLKGAKISFPYVDPHLFSFQGLYVFAVYFIMHNQLCWPTKASYTVEMNGNDRPDSTFQAGGPTTVGSDISKSTQNLISAMEEVCRA